MESDYEAEPKNEVKPSRVTKLRRKDACEDCIHHKLCKYEKSAKECEGIELPEFLEGEIRCIYHKSVLTSPAT